MKCFVVQNTTISRESFQQLKTHYMDCFPCDLPPDCTFFTLFCYQIHYWENLFNSKWWPYRGLTEVKLILEDTHTRWVLNECQPMIAVWGMGKLMWRRRTTQACTTWYWGFPPLEEPGHRYITVPGTTLKTSLTRNSLEILKCVMCWDNIPGVAETLNLVDSISAMCMQH